jgi:hypothetical protein
MPFSQHTLQEGAGRLRAWFVDRAGRELPASVVAVGAEAEAFRRWVDDLPPAGNEALMQLRQYGFICDLAALEAELLHTLTTGPAGPLARAVGQRVLDLLAGRGDAVCLLLDEG